MDEDASLQNVRIWIFYCRDFFPLGRLLKIRLQTPHPNTDFSPDHRRFLMLPEPAQSPGVRCQQARQTRELAEDAVGQLHSVRQRTSIRKGK
jgi:hypothetical protein